MLCFEIFKNLKVYSPPYYSLLLFIYENMYMRYSNDMLNWSTVDWIDLEKFLHSSIKIIKI